MAQIQWGVPRTRTIETGVDRGVLYIEGVASGVAWSGLTSITRSQPEAQLEPIYFDGVIANYMAHRSPTTYTINALSTPPDFQRCLGRVPLTSGFYAANQPHASFGFTYRTLIANDLVGLEYGYKIHIIFQAYAVERSVSYSSVTTNVNVGTQSFEVRTIPVLRDNSDSISHISVSSTSVSPQSLESLEDILYGTDVTDPSLPTIDELITLLS